MLMRKAEIDNNVCEIKTRWLNGGYSDDLLVGACAFDHDRTIATPLRALFPNTVKKDVTFEQAWDFMRRQCFTLITYSSGKHCIIAFGVLIIYGVGGCLPLPSFVLALFTLSFAGTLAALEPWSFDNRSVILWVNIGLAAGFLLLFLLAMLLQRRYLRRCWKLAQSLSPNHIIMDWTMSWYQQIGSFFLESVLSPFIAMSVLCRRSSVWGGITYHVRSGKVVRVVRPKEKKKTRRPEVQDATELATPISFSY